MQLGEGFMDSIPLLHGRGDGRELTDALRGLGVERGGEGVGEARVFGGEGSGALEEGRWKVWFRVWSCQPASASDRSADENSPVVLRRMKRGATKRGAPRMGHGRGTGSLLIPARVFRGCCGWFWSFPRSRCNFGARLPVRAGYFSVRRGAHLRQCTEYLLFVAPHRELHTDLALQFDVSHARGTRIHVL